MTVSDRKIPNGSVGSPVTYFNADVMSGNDYYPFGQLISARRSIYGNYRFAYNGKEKEDEIYSPTNAYNYGMRMYDSRLGRFMSVDPLINKYAMLTPFQYATDRPIDGGDKDGMEWKSLGKYGFSWDPDHAYTTDNAGNQVLKAGYYNQAIYFTDNGTYKPTSGKNIGSSTAIVCLSDGTIKEYNACTMPSESNITPTAEGSSEAVYGTHKGSVQPAYPALKDFSIGVETGNTFSAANQKLYLGDGVSDARNIHQVDVFEGDAVQPDAYEGYMLGQDIHHAGKRNWTGTFTGDDNKIHDVSEGCYLIDVTQWSDFMNNFSSFSGDPMDPSNRIGIYTSRTYNPSVPIPCGGNQNNNVNDNSSITSGKEVQLTPNSDSPTF